GRTRTRHREKALREAHLSLTAAGAAHFGTGPRLLARAPARLARLQARDLELRLESLRGLVERDLEIVAEVIAAPRARPPRTLAAAEEAFEEVFEDRPEPDIADAARPGHRPEAVVLGALLGIREDPVSLVDLLEALLGLLVPGVLVRVVGPREVPVRLLQLSVVCVARHAEHAVVVLGRHHLEQGCAGGAGARRRSIRCAPRPGLWLTTDARRTTRREPRP